MKVLSIVCFGAGLLLIVLGTKSTLDKHSRDKLPPTREDFERINSERFNTDPDRREMDIYNEEPTVEPPREIDFLTLGYFAAGAILIAIGIGLRSLNRRTTDDTRPNNSADPTSDQNDALE
jgi:hypothetical protein